MNQVPCVWELAWGFVFLFGCVSHTSGTSIACTYICTLYILMYKNLYLSGCVAVVDTMATVFMLGLIGLSFRWTIQIRRKENWSFII